MKVKSFAVEQPVSFEKVINEWLASVPSAEIIKVTPIPRKEADRNAVLLVWYEGVE